MVVSVCPHSPTTSASTLHVLLFPGRMDPAGSVTTGEEGERVATAIFFRSGEGERVRSKWAALASKR